MNAVIQEIQTRVTSSPTLEGKAVDALYFGGATANLTPAEPFRRLCRKLNELFDLRHAEVTLEGVPAFFLNRKPWLLDISSGDQIGLDQVCLYHLVMFRGLATAWSRDPALIAALPSNEMAAANWAAIRSAVLDSGFYQTTLTNFERSSFRGDLRSYIYELRSFESDQYNMIGFGPSGISYSSSDPSCSGLKTAWDVFFGYDRICTRTRRPCRTAWRRVG